MKPQTLTYTPSGIDTLRGKKSAAWSTLLAYVLVFASPFAQAAPGTLSNVPLFLTSPVQPNVMLLIDNSGSMNNITWATGYTTTTIQPNWGGATWNATSSNVKLSSISGSGDRKSVV